MAAASNSGFTVPSGPAPLGSGDGDLDADRQLRENWVKTQLIHTFMGYAFPALYSVTIVLAILVAILYGHVDGLALAVWAALALAITTVRYGVCLTYQRRHAASDWADLQAFMSRFAWTWTCSAFVWGCSLLVFFLKAPLYQQFTCLIVLVAMPGYAVGTFSAYPRCFNGYINGLMVGVLGSMAFRLLTSNDGFGSLNAFGLMLLALIYWLVIRSAGQRFHDAQRINLELQFDNTQLIASLMQKNRAALSAVETKNRMIASAAHDLRQPVHALDLYATWLAAEPELADQIAPKIVRSIQAVNELFNSLFDFAGLNAEALKVNLQSVDLALLVRDLEEQYAPVAQERGLRLRCRVAAGRVQSDPLLLKRLLGNFLSNALKNTHSGGVLMSARRRRGTWCIEIWDSGLGIADEHQQVIFDEFYRIPTVGTGEGFGLGLAIVTRLSQLLGHTIGMRSRLGRGSVFWVELGSSDEPRLISKAGSPVTHL